jgi:predicted deacylase
LILKKIISNVLPLVTKTSNAYFDSYTITTKVDTPHVLIIAGIHGDEFEPMVAALNLVHSLQKKLTKGRVTIVPVANIFAFDLGNRCGADGLDLARTLPGKERGSITYKTAKAISDLIRTSDYLIDLHTGGTLFDIMPLSGYMLHPVKEVLEQQQKMAKAFNLPIVWGTDAKAQGRTLSVARDYNIPAIYVECRGGLNINKATIKIYEDGCINVLRSLGLIKPDPKQKKNLFTWLEDHRPGQGHLQTKLPSPDNGIFIPEVSLGKKIKKGSLLGHVINPLLHKKTKIVFEEDGLVFMLRASSRVNTGDTLGGILPITGKTKKIIHAK